MASYQKRQTKKGTVWDVVYWVTEDGKRVQKKMCGYSSKQEAQEEYEKHDKDSDVSIVPSAKSVTVKEATETYIELNREILAPMTFYSNCRILRSLVLPYFSSKRIENITRSDIARWMETIWNMKTQKGELMAQETCVKYRNVFCSFMKWAVDMYSLKTNPFDGLKMPHRRETKKEMQVWTVKEFNSFISHVKNIKYKIFFTLLFLTGCRRGEINALTVDDFVKTDGRYSIKISKTAADVPGRGVVVTPPKTDSSIRTVSLPIGMTPVIDKFLEGKTGYIWYKAARCFSLPFKIATAAVHVKPIRIHDLRHSHASILISAGIPVTTVSKRLGHASVKITLDTYSHCFESDDENILSILDKFPK